MDLLCATASVTRHAACLSWQEQSSCIASLVLHLMGDTSPKGHRPICLINFLTLCKVNR
jgi:hypothetical protein